jgi:hypothetical protein
MPCSAVVRVQIGITRATASLVSALTGSGDEEGAGADKAGHTSAENAPVSVN